MSGLILIVEDETDLADLLEHVLQRAGYQTRTAHDGASALEQACREPVPDLVLLDLMLPDFPGTEVCRQLRAREATAAVPIVIVSARDDEIDRIVGFEVGADDYVVKPYSIRELLLRVATILGRTQRVRTLERAVCGRVTLDRADHRVWVDDAEVRLTALEFELLATLMDREGFAQTRDALLDDVWGYSPNVTTRTVDVHIRRLRKKLGEAAAYVETLKGVGYRFRAA